MKMTAGTGGSDEYGELTRDADGMRTGTGGKGDRGSVLDRSRNGNVVGELKWL